MTSKWDTGPRTGELSLGSVSSGSEVYIPPQRAVAPVAEADGIYTSVEFFVPGVAHTKGSHRAFVVKGRAIMTNDNPKEKGWRATIALVAHEAMAGRALLDGAVHLELTFVRPRPKGHFNAKGIVRPGVLSAQPSTKPDWDKMGRSVGDALNGICYRDDAQITTAIVRKRWGEAGVHVVVRQDTAS